MGTFFVNCRLQTGQGFVITFVMILFSLLTSGPPSKSRCTLLARRIARRRIVRPKTRWSQMRPPCVCASKSTCHFSALFGQRVAEHDRGDFEAGLSRFLRSPFRVGNTESCRDTALAVAQIFSVTSRKFRSVAGSAVYSAQNRMASDGKALAF